MIESMSGAAKRQVLPVVGGYIIIHVQVLIVAKILGIFVCFICQQAQFILPIGIVSGREHIQFIGYFLPAIVSIIADTHFTFFSALGGHNDYTVGTTRTINGCGGGIFQDCDVFNVSGRYVGDTLYGEAVDNKQRFVALCDRATASYTDGHRCVG